MSSTLARHRKPSRLSRAQPDTPSGHRKLSPVVSARRHKAAWAAAAVAAGSALLLSAWPAAAHWVAHASGPAWVDQADALGLQAAAWLGEQADQAGQPPKIVSVGVSIGYLNPLRDVGGLILERVDMGVDFAGSGPVYALGDGIVTNATGDNGGWPGGGWITYQLTNGPAAGLTVYVAEDVTPDVQVGQYVSPSTVIGTMFNGPDGIETGWAQPGGLSSESELPEAGGIGGPGPFPTMVGLNFDELLQWLGVPAAPNFTQPGSGLLPPNYPTKWG